MGELDTSTILKSKPWSSDEIGILTSTLASGGTVRDAARLLDRTLMATQSAATDRGLRSFKSVKAATQERIRDLSAEGYAPARIAVRLGVQVEAVLFYLQRTPA